MPTAVEENGNAVNASKARRECKADAGMKVAPNI
jgi:hypothetical protein